MKIDYKLVLGILCLFLLLVIGIFNLYPKTTTIQKSVGMGRTHLAGNYQVQIKLAPAKPVTGNNQLTLFISNEKDQPITTATIEAYAEMPAMGSMQAMREVVDIENQGEGIYQGQYSLPMNGIWPLTISIESPTLGKAELSFDMSTSRTGLKLTQATLSQLSPTEDQQEAQGGQPFTTLTVDNYRRQLIGVTLAEVVCQKLVKTIQAGARVNYDETRLTDISLKYDAWIGQLNADYVGKQIQQGETLFTVYSPQLVSAQDEYLDSLKSAHAFGLRKAARKRLTLWDITHTQIKALEKRGRASDYLPIVSPVNGTIIDKQIVTGTAVKAGARLLRLADLSTVWIEGEVYESDLPWLKLGMAVQITLPEQPGHVYAAKLAYIDPILNPQTRSAVIRAQVANTNGLLRPDMYVAMNLKVDLGKRMLVPEQAVIYSGDQRIVFIDQGEGRLLPKRIRIGLRNKDMIEVLDGLQSGDRIVSSGNFLIASESKLKSGLAQW